MSKATRRMFLLASLGFLAGCGGKATQLAMPGVPWDRGRSVRDEPPADPRVFEPARPVPSPTQPTMPGVLSRNQWATGSPIPTRMERLSGINRITVHHDGMNPDWATSERDAAARIDLIRRSHQNMGWGDIGYHYVIDRSGRVWEGRPIRFQGAHVRHHNEGNIGVLCTGNFEHQEPSRPQREALVRHLRALMARYSLSRNQIHTHLELGPTLCPGRSLQQFMVDIRRSGALA